MSRINKKILKKQSGRQKFLYYYASKSDSYQGSGFQLLTLFMWMVSLT